MKIEKVQQGAAIVALTPDDLLLLAMACAVAADYWDPEAADHHTCANRPTAYTFGLMASCLDGLAIASSSSGFLTPQEEASTALNAIAREWHVKPGILDGNGGGR